MIYKSFGKNLNVSSIVLGCDVYGSDLSEKTSFELLDSYLSLGGNTIDTARMYGNGASEQTIGKWLSERKCRDKVIISTKCAHPPVSDMKKSRLSAKEIFSDVDQSLLALNCDYIDILWLHRDDESLPVCNIIDSLNALVLAGKVRAFGASNWHAERIRQANEYAAKTSQQGFLASQIKWCIAASSPQYQDDPTLVEMNKTEYDFYKKSCLGVFAYASQAKGFFYKYDQGKENALSKKSRQRYLCEENIKIYHELKKLCESDNISLTSAVISALTSNTDFPTVAIVGCKDTSQLKTTFEAADTVIDYKKILKLLKY